MEFLNIGWQALASVIGGLIWLNYKLLNGAVKSREDGVLKDMQKLRLEIREEMRKEFLIQIEKQSIICEKQYKHLERNVDMKINYFLGTEKNNNKDHENI